jgi:hypothetical protein
VSACTHSHVGSPGLMNMNGYVHVPLNGNSSMCLDFLHVCFSLLSVMKCSCALKSVNWC